jgi:hypothetical protein
MHYTIDISRDLDEVVTGFPESWLSLDPLAIPNLGGIGCVI